jgi:hypothetical protein
VRAAPELSVDADAFVIRSPLEETALSRIEHVHPVDRTSTLPQVR